jgi:hypothetical protein
VKRYSLALSLYKCRCITAGLAVHPYKQRFHLSLYKPTIAGLAVHPYYFIYPPIKRGKNLNAKKIRKKKSINKPKINHFKTYL